MYKKKEFTVLLSLLILVFRPVAVLACATCGCSELCPLAMMKDDESDSKFSNSLSDSLWGNIILKMAYQRDPQLQKLMRSVKRVNAITSGSVTTAIGGTTAQNILSLATLNQDQGNDSYLPGALGLGMSGLINITLDGSILINWRLKKKIRVRQLIVKQKVETIVNHLEFSRTSCPEAQGDLSEMIGERAANDCIKLWQSSHMAAYATVKNKTISEALPVNQAL